MPEASDPTPGEHEPRDNETKVSLYSKKRIRCRRKAGNETSVSLYSKKEYVAGETGNGHGVAKK